ncbi:triphosphoribosyl-dephospho-CoA synthase [Xanthobacter sp. KR7-65]|uniref:triphosphoribosyl-dephospho-CoA synthase n=1 Tax=Xanthobacter sp. KR7-65 TaxID=3156612 RepID=UPI0032B4A44B
MRALSSDEVAAAFRAACRAELQALKPGNVHVFAAGHGMETAQFERAADAAAPAIARTALPVGARVLAAVEASLAAAGCNTNLGILLLCAPLAAAAQMDGTDDLSTRLTGVLDGLDRTDADAAFRAIAAASPGGLGAATEADVHKPAQVTLGAAMALAAARDSIARQYTTGFADIFALGVPPLAAEPTARGPVEEAYLAFLATLPDSHIARKFGSETAERVRTEAEALRRTLPGLGPNERHDALLAFDAALKARGLNPGTSADLTVASIFAALMLSATTGR